MAFHRAQAEKQFITEGMSAADAHQAAARQFGNPTVLRERSQEVVGFRWETILQDLRFAFRQLRQNPGFAFTATLILALGMGISVAIFAFVDAALIRPLPYFAPNRLMDVAESGNFARRTNLSRDDFDDWRRLNHSFASLSAYHGTGFLLGTPSGPEPVPAARVSDDFFRTLGVSPMLGRDFLPGEDQPGRAKITILPYATWQTRFGARPGIVGQSVTLDNIAYTIVGVLPRDYEFAPRSTAQFYIPMLDKNNCEQRRSCHNLFAVGRLRDGVSPQAALQEMKAIAAQLAIQYPGSNKGQGATVQPLTEIIVGQVRPILRTLLAAAGLLLLIAAINVANLLLVRSESRRREIAVRGALGATRTRLTRQFVTETLLLAIAGCLAGMLISTWTMSLLKSLIPKSIDSYVGFLDHVGLHQHSVLFSAAVALLATVLMALTPVLRLSLQDVCSSLTDGGRTAAGRFWSRVGANLVVLELAIAVILLVGAGLLAKSFYHLLHVDLGFDPTHLATVQMAAPDVSYPKPEQKVALFREITRRLSALPGVESVGITSDLPVQCNCDTDWIRVVGKPFHGEHNEVDERDVSPQYLSTLKVRLLHGRLLAEDDTNPNARKIVINEAFAKKYLPGEDPIGHKIGDGGLTPKSMREIVGVVDTLREGGLDDDLWPAEYESMYAGPDSYAAIAVRTSGNEKQILPTLVKTIHQVDPNVGTYGEITMEDQINTNQSAILHRFSTFIVGGFALIAMVLSVVGLYGVIAYSVSQRTREIGVRMALGAQRSTVHRMVMRQAGWLTAAGVAIGIVCAGGCSMLMGKILFGVQPWDAPTLAGVAVILGASSLAASFLPARRAASVNPIEALRTE
jgi:predicted permease